VTEPATAPPEYQLRRPEALFINCALKKSPEPSHTQGLRRPQPSHHGGPRCAGGRGSGDHHDIATGVWPDMSEHGWESDEWPGIFEEVKAADILVLAGPIWLGDNSSVMKQVHERLYAGSHLLNDRGQYLYYGRVGGCLITGNEDNDFTNRNNVHDWNLMHWRGCSRTPVVFRRTATRGPGGTPAAASTSTPRLPMTGVSLHGGHVGHRGRDRGGCSLR